MKSLLLSLMFSVFVVPAWAAGSFVSPIAVTTCTTHEWVEAITSGGAVTCTQPAIGDISGFGTGVATGLANAVTGSGAPVLATSPTLVTPTLGAASATSVNGIAITSSTGTLVPGTGTATFPAGNSGTVAELNLAQSWTAAQRGSTETPTPVGTTFTPAGSAQNIRIDFPATTCSCTIANFSTITAGQSGVIELVQGATSVSLNPTWGSAYEYPGGTSTIVLTTTLGGVDYIPYYVESTGTFIVLGSIDLKPVH